MPGFERGPERAERPGRSGPFGAAPRAARSALRSLTFPNAISSSEKLLLLQTSHPAQLHLCRAAGAGGAAELRGAGAP